MVSTQTKTEYEPLNPASIHRDVHRFLEGLYEQGFSPSSSTYEVCTLNLHYREVERDIVDISGRLIEPRIYSDMNHCSKFDRFIRVGLLPSYNPSTSLDKFLIDFVSEETDFVAHDPVRGTFYFTCNLSYGDFPVDLMIGKSPRAPESTHLTLLSRTTADGRIKVSSFLRPPTHVKVGYDFTKHPELRSQLADMAEKRLPADVYRNASTIGTETPEGFNLYLRLWFQSPNNSDHLRCYEVELKKPGSGHNDFLSETRDFSPETIWQPEEGHFCLADQKTYPFVPVNLDSVARLIVEADSHKNGYESFPSDPYVGSLLADMSLSIDGTNHWYAGRSWSDAEHMNTFYRPGKGNTILYYIKRKNTITPEEVREGVEKMKEIRDTLTERSAS